MIAKFVRREKKIEVKKAKITVESDHGTKTQTDDIRRSDFRAKCTATRAENDPPLNTHSLAMAESTA